MRSTISRFAADYGMLFVLLLLCAFLSWATYKEQTLTGAAAGDQVAAEIQRRAGPDAKTLIVVSEGDSESQFVAAARERLGTAAIAVVQGRPSDLRAALNKLADSGERLDAIAAGPATSSWTLLQDLGEKFPHYAKVLVVSPQASGGWPTFLTSENLLNVVNHVAVNAIIAIGMTMVIIVGGIDLSVGSLLALSAVCAALVIDRFGGGSHASQTWVLLGIVSGIAVCAAWGLFSGFMVAMFRIPAFIVTLAVLLIARGLAGELTNSQSIANLPDSFTWLGRGANLGVPNAVVLMLLLYAVAHLVMSRTTLGRYIYAVGGNAQAARLSGVRVERVVLAVFTIGGALAGLGGILTASLLKSGDPNFGQLVELRVIAAVVVGGTSLNGGQGKVLGTLIGTLIIGVIDNGMNLLGLPSNEQLMVLGAVILAAVLLDTLKNKSWRRA